MICGNCAGCFACGKYCSGCPGCHRLFRGCGPGERCKLCPYVCPDRPGLPAFLAWRLGNTLELEPVRAQNVELPEHLPLVATRLFEEPPADLSAWYALNAAKVSDEFWRTGKVREIYGFPKDSKVALSFYAPDRMLEKFWLRRGERYRTIKEEFDAVFAPNFSVYEDSPRMEHLVSMRRSNAVAAEMAKYGIPVIPDISWYNKEDLDRWVEFVKKSKGLSAVAFSFQTVGRSNKSSAAWQSYLAGLRYFHQRIPGEIRIVLVGVNSLTRMAEAFKIVGERKITFLDTLSFYTARKGGVLKVTGHERAKGVSRDGAFFESMKVFRERLREARAEIGTGQVGIQK